jgi:hypothetical protein
VLECGHELDDVLEREQSRLGQQRPEAIDALLDMTRTTEVDDVAVRGD